MISLTFKDKEFQILLPLTIVSVLDSRSVSFILEITERAQLLHLKTISAAILSMLVGEGKMLQGRKAIRD